MTTSIPLRVCQTRSVHLESQKKGKTKMLERRVRTAKYLVFRTRENPWKQRETGGRKILSCGGFRVRIAVIICGSFFVFNGPLDILSVLDSRVCWFCNIIWIAQNSSIRIAPCIRPSPHKICIHRVETPHFSAVCETDRYLQSWIRVWDYPKIAVCPDSGCAC